MNRTLERIAISIRNRVRGHDGNHNNNNNTLSPETKSPKKELIKLGYSNELFIRSNKTAEERAVERKNNFTDITALIKECITRSTNIKSSTLRYIQTFPNLSSPKGLPYTFMSNLTNEEKAVIDIVGKDELDIAHQRALLNSFNSRIQAMEGQVRDLQTQEQVENVLNHLYRSYYNNNKVKSHLSTSASWISVFKKERHYELTYAARNLTSLYYPYIVFEGQEFTTNEHSRELNGKALAMIPLYHSLGETEDARLVFLNIMKEAASVDIVLRSNCNQDLKENIWKLFSERMDDVAQALDEVGRDPQVSDGEVLQHINQTHFEGLTLNRITGTENLLNL